MARYQMRATNNGNINQELGFTDIILILGVFVNIASLFVNSQNNNALDQINANLKKINENGSLDMIAQIGNNNRMEVTVEDDENEK